MAKQNKNAKNIPEETGLNNQAEAKDVWIFIEQINGEIAPVSLELAGEGRKLADALGEELAGVLFGEQIEFLTEELFKYGFDKIYLIDDPVLKDYRTRPYGLGLAKLANLYKPGILLLGATSLGRDLSGNVATELQTGLTADCTQLAIDLENGLLEQTRPAFGGNILATILCKEKRPQMATVRPRVLPMPIPGTTKPGLVIKEELELAEEEIGVEVLERIAQEGSATFLDRAEIIVAGGRGIGSKENFGMLEELAGVLGGTLGASRAAVEAGWIGIERQVGQTGITVRPKVYFAIGISGAIQHLVGMQTADVIVAINQDREAPIFKIADYGLVGDFKKILPELICKFEQKLLGKLDKEAHDAYN